MRARLIPKLFLCLGHWTFHPDVAVPRIDHDFIGIWNRIRSDSTKQSLAPICQFYLFHSLIIEEEFPVLRIKELGGNLLNGLYEKLASLIMEGENSQNSL